MPRKEHDHFDARRNFPIVVGEAISISAATAAYPLARTLGSPTLVETFIGTSMYAGMSFAYGVWIATEASKMIPSGAVKDRKLKYHAQPYVRRENNDLRINSDRVWPPRFIGNRDVFYWMELPELSVQKAAPDQQGDLITRRNALWGEANLAALRQFVNRTSLENYHAVAIVLPENTPYQVRDNLPRTTPVLFGDLFKGKGTPTKADRTVVDVISRSELEEFFRPKPKTILVPRVFQTHEPKQVIVPSYELEISEFAKALQIEEVLLLLRAANEAKDRISYQKHVKSINEILDRVMLNEIEKDGHAALSTKSQHPSSPLLPRITRKTERTMLVRNGPKGKYLQIFSDGIASTQPLNRRTFGLEEGQTWEELKPSKNNKAQVAFLMGEQLAKDGVESFFEYKEVPKEVTHWVPKEETRDVSETIYEDVVTKSHTEIAKEAKELGVKLKRSKIAPPGPAFFEWRKFGNKFKDWKNIAGAALTVAAICAGSSFLGDLMTPRPAEEKYSDSVNANQRPQLLTEAYRGLSDLIQSNPQLVDAIQPAVRKVFEAVNSYPEPSLPSDAIIWTIESYDGIDATGYYTLSTSSEYDSGEWNMNKTRQKELELPEKVQGQPHIVLSQHQYFNPTTGSTFKIPLKHGTKIAGLEILNLAGQSLERQIFELKDGTIEVIVPKQSILSGNLSISVRASLITSESRSIHATEPVAPIDKDKLNQRALDTLNKALADPSKFEDTLVEAIKTSHLYSLRPNNWEKFKPVQSAEDRVNVEAEWTECFCFPCNELKVLLASRHPEGVPVNLVLGYRVGLGDVASEEKKDYRRTFLRPDIAHAWGVNQYGRILDATPGEIADDELTRRYVQQLRRQPPPPPTPATPLPAVATAASYIEDKRREFLATATPIPVIETPTTQPAPTITTTPTAKIEATKAPTAESPTPVLPNVTVTVEAPAPILPSATATVETVTKPDITSGPDHLSGLVLAAALVAAGIAGGVYWGSKRRKNQMIEVPVQADETPTPAKPEITYQEVRGDLKIKQGDSVVTLNDKDLVLASQLLPWVTYGNKDQAGGQIETVEERLAYYKKWGKPLPDLKFLRNNIALRDLEVYLRHPGIFERSLRMNKQQATKMQALAKLIVSLGDQP